MPTNAEKLASAIEATGYAIVIKKTEPAGSVRLLCRVSDKKSWCALLEYVLSRKNAWTEHVCQQYFMNDGKLVYGWNFVLTAADIDTAVENAWRLFKAAATVTSVPRTKKSMRKGSIDEVPLVGASPNRNSKGVFDPRLPGPSKGGPSHKGVYNISEGG
jgi:hypothetical protein